MALARRLRTVATEARHQSAALRQAMEALVGHVDGVLQRVHAALSAAGVYGQRGRIAVGTQLNFTVDLRS